MVIRLLRFNSYLLLLALAVAGCATTSASKKPYTRLTVNVEANRYADGQGETIQVSRAQPITLNIQKSSIVNESHVAEARLDDGFSGYTMVIQFTDMGKHLLEQATASNPGRHFAIAAQFGAKPDQAEIRWIAAPIIRQRITDGILAFTPDASREEAELIVKGLNNMAIKLENQQKNKLKAKD